MSDFSRTVKIFFGLIGALLMIAFAVGMSYLSYRIVGWIGLVPAVLVLLWVTAQHLAKRQKEAEASQAR